MSKRLFFKKPWFWVAVSALVVFMLMGYLYALVAEGIKPIVVFEINSKPSDAFVYFDDDIIGRTPHKLEVEGRLTGRLRIVSDGYKEIDRAIEVEPGKSESVMFHLLKDTRLTVNSKPQGANLYIDGDLWGSTPCTIEGFIDVGAHVVRVEMLDRCFGEVTKDIELVLGEDLVIGAEEIVLPELNTVTINSQPLGATISSDGIEWGMTPLTKCLPSGSYKISFEKEDFATEEKEFELSSDASVYVKMLDPESYLKRNHFEADSNIEATVFAVPKKADNFSPLYGESVVLGVSPVSIDSDELMEKTGISTKPYSYILTASAKGYEPGITEMTEPGSTYFNLSELPSSVKSYQGKYLKHGISSTKPNELTSPDSRFEIKADKNSAVMTEVLNGKTHNLYVESDYKHNEFKWSSDSKSLWYFRNNVGVRELVRLDTETMEIEIIDSFDLSQFNASEIIPDKIFGCMTAVEHAPSVTKLYYLIPGSVKDKLTLVSNSPKGGNRTVIEKNFVPVVDKWSIWLESKNVLKMTGYFPGLIRHDGYYLLDKEEPVHFEITSNPDSVSKVGQIKQVNSGITMFPSAALIKKTSKDVVVSAQLYKGLSIVFVYHPTSDEFELMDVILK